MEVAGGGIWWTSPRLKMCWTGDVLKSTISDLVRRQTAILARITRATTIPFIVPLAALSLSHPRSSRLRCSISVLPASGVLSPSSRSPVFCLWPPDLRCSVSVLPVSGVLPPSSRSPVFCLRPPGLRCSVSVLPVSGVLSPSSRPPVFCLRLPGLRCSVSVLPVSGVLSLSSVLPASGVLSPFSRSPVFCLRPPSLRCSVSVLPASGALSPSSRPPVPCLCPLRLVASSDLSHPSLLRSTHEITGRLTDRRWPPQPDRV